MKHKIKGMTLVELLVVVSIVIILGGLLAVNSGKMLELSQALKHTSNVRDITMSTLLWSSDNGNKLPSPKYPGGMEIPPGSNIDNFFPENWNNGGTGVWLDGVIFGSVYGENNKNSSSKYDVSNYEIDKVGTHLKNTIFESKQSLKRNPDVKDIHFHSYAMNKDLAFDPIYKLSKSDNKELTEKSISNLIAPSALLYIESNLNIVGYRDRSKIIETGKNRWRNKKVIAAFLDGHVERLSENKIPRESPVNDRKSSLFWRGVDIK